MGSSQSAPLNKENGAATTIVKIQDLPLIEEQKRSGRNCGGGEYKNADVKKNWSKCKHNRSVSWPPKDPKQCPCRVLYEAQNNEINSAPYTSHAFLDAVLRAYNNHEDLVLSPDDIWMLVCVQFSEHVNMHAEELRDLFVSHQGKKMLQVKTYNETSESEWSEFFALIEPEIKKNTKGEIVDTLRCSFTTTGDVEQTLSTVSVMSAFKAYFEYGRCIPLCGIAQVHFLGTLEDWTSLKEKLLALRQYAVPDQGVTTASKKALCTWKRYVDTLAPVIDKLIETYQGAPDVEWWNKIIDQRFASRGSGQTSYLSGWVLALLNVHREIETDDIKESHFEVPVLISNHITQTQKTVHLIGGFYGVHTAAPPTKNMPPAKTPKNADDKTTKAACPDAACPDDARPSHRPVLSMIVYHDGNEQPLENAQSNK